jgi:hypothetical protein
VRFEHREAESVRTGEAPAYGNVEQFVRRLQACGLLVRSRLGAGDASRRTRQRRHRAVTGLSEPAVTPQPGASGAVRAWAGPYEWPARAAAVSTAHRRGIL